jgi:hypothetical protein
MAEYERVAARLKTTFGDEVEIPSAISASSTAELQTAINHFRERLADAARQAREAATRARPRSVGFLEAVTAIATPRKVPKTDPRDSDVERKVSKAKSKKSKKKKKQRDSLSSATSNDSSASEGEDTDPEDRLNRKWGTRNVDPKIFKLSYPLSSSIRVRYGVGVEDGYIGLAFLEDITRYGEQSLASWFKDQDFDDQKNKRVVSELRFLVFLADLHLRDARCVAAARSGCKILDSIGRRIYVLNGVYFEALGWLQAERLLPVTSVKSERGGAVSLMAGVSSQLAKISKAEKVLKGDVSGTEAGGGKVSAKGKDGSA